MDGLFQPFADPCRIAAAVRNGPDEYGFPTHCVEHSKWKSLAQKAVIIFVCLPVYATVKSERVDVAIQIAQEAGTEPGLLSLVKVKSFNQILCRLIKNLNPPEILSDMRFLAVSQSMNRALPCSIRRSRSSRRSLCQWGTGTDSSRRHRSSQSASMARSFSSTVISAICRSTGMGSIYSVSAQQQPEIRGWRTV